MVWVRVTFFDIPAFPVKMLKNRLDHCVAWEIADRSCFLDSFLNVFTSVLWIKRNLVILGSKNVQNFKNLQRRPERILRTELIGERTFYKYKPLCKPRARFKDPTWEPIYNSYGQITHGQNLLKFSFSGKKSHLLEIIKN